MKSLDRLKSFKSEYKDVYILYHDFANGINMRTILWQWKDELENFGCEFPLFETGEFYLFLKEGNTDIDKPLIKSWLNRAKDNLEKLTGFSNSAIPGAVAVTTIADISVEALSSIPGINTVNGLIKLLNQYLAADKTNAAQVYGIRTSWKNICQRFLLKIFSIGQAARKNLSYSWTVAS